jgi:hypothetical protein
MVKIAHLKKARIKAMLTTQTYKNALKIKDVFESVEYVQSFCEAYNVKLELSQEKRSVLYTLRYNGVTLIDRAKLKSVCKYIHIVKNIGVYHRGVQYAINLFHVYNFNCWQLGPNECQWTFDTTDYIQRFVVCFSLKESKKLTRMLEDILPDEGSINFVN